MVEVGPGRGAVAAGPDAAAVAQGDGAADGVGKVREARPMSRTSPWPPRTAGRTFASQSRARVAAGESRVPSSSRALAVRFSRSARVMVTVRWGRWPPWVGSVPASRAWRRAAIRAWAWRVAAGRVSRVPSVAAGHGAASPSRAVRTVAMPRSSRRPLIGVSPVAGLRVPMCSSAFDAGSRSSRVPSGSRVVIRWAARVAKCRGSNCWACSTRWVSARSRTSGAMPVGQVAHGGGDGAGVVGADQSGFQRRTEDGQAWGR